MENPLLHGSPSLPELLPHIPLLTPLTSAQAALLAEAASIRHFSKGQVIFEEGGPAQGFYILLQGLIKMFHITPDGKEMVLHLVRPPATFGEVPVFKGKDTAGGGVWPASAAAVQPSRALFIPGPFFRPRAQQSRPRPAYVGCTGPTPVHVHTQT